MGLRDRIKGRQRKAAVPFFVSGWGETVLLKTFTVAELFAAKKDIRARVPKGAELEDVDFVVGMVVAGTLDEDGAPAFTADDIPILKDQDGTGVSEVFAELDRMNGITEAGAESIRKNLPKTPNGNGCSSLPIAGVSASPNCSAAPAPAS